VYTHHKGSKDTQGSSKGRLPEIEQRLPDSFENNFDILNNKKCRNNFLQFDPSILEHENHNPAKIGILGLSENFNGRALIFPT